MENTNTPKEIATGDIVLYNGGWFRVRKVTRNTVNLGSVFGRTLYHRGVPKDQVKEDQAAWYAAWQKTDAYQSM